MIHRDDTIFAATRKKEERWLHKTAYFQSLSISLTPAVPVISAIITFLAHVASGSGLTAAQVTRQRIKSSGSRLTLARSAYV